MSEQDKNSLTKAEKMLLEKLAEQRTKIQTKYPLLFILLATFGAVATFQGFNKIVNDIDIFANHPWIMFVAGLLILMGTGTLYQKLK